MKHPVDVHVGKRVRHRRWMVGMTQQQLGDIVGIKFQQIQKYETGMNRISASRLWDIAQALDVSISFFFEGFEGEAEAGDRAPPPPSAAICSPTRRRSSWCAPTTRSPRRSAAVCSISPASSATWPDSREGVGAAARRSPRSQPADSPRTAPPVRAIVPGSGRSGARPRRSAPARSMKISWRAPASSTSSPLRKPMRDPRHVLPARRRPPHFRAAPAPGRRASGPAATCRASRSAEPVQARLGPPSASSG